MTVSNAAAAERCGAPAPGDVASAFLPVDDIMAQIACMNGTAPVASGISPLKAERH